MTHSTTLDHGQLMTTGTFNFLLDTLMHEIEMHEHRDELVTLLHEQQQDDRNLCNG
jgi:hypothetical protein